MKALVCINRSYRRHFVTVIQELTERGYELLFIDETDGCEDKVSVLKNGHRELQLNLNHRGAWLRTMEKIRHTRCQIFFLQPFFERHPYLRTRFESFTDPFVHRLLSSKLPFLLKGLDRIFRGLENALPLPERILNEMRAFQPDLVIVTPLIFMGQVHQYDYLKCARALGIPSVFPVFSWDNLTTKGALLDIPDFTIVWNETQVAELEKLHRVPREKILVSGAYRFDEFLSLRPSVDRSPYLRNLGLDSAQKTLLYIGSSELCAPDEGKFCGDWIREVRKKSSANIVVRPHPRNTASYENNDDLRREGVALSLGTSLKESQSLYDALTYSDAVIGINTSAMLEAAVLGKSVFTVSTPLTKEWQQRTLHFEYLQNLLHHADSFEEHLRQLEGTKGGADPRSVRFAQSFLGLGGGESPTVRFAEALERAVRAGSAPAPRKAAGRIPHKFLEAYAKISK